MVENLWMTSEKLVSKFKIKENQIYDLVLFSDGIWFSFEKKYPNGIMFRPAKTKDFQDDSVARIRISYQDKKMIDWKVPIYLKVSKQSRYLMKGNYDYDFKDENCPTKESLDLSNQSWQPIELESYWDYFYDTVNGVFLKKEKNINPISMIDDIFNLHIKTVHRFKWIVFRFRLNFRDIIASISKILILLIKKILKFFFWRKLEKKSNNDIQEMFLIDSYSKEDLLATYPDKISILWYDMNITKQSLLTLCFIVCVFYIWACYLKNDFGWLFSNQIFVWALFLISIHILDNWIPNLLRRLLNLLIKIKNKFMFMKLKIK